MPQALLTFALVLLVAGIFVAFRIINARHRKRWESLVRDAHDASVSLEEATKVQELLVLYLDILLVHGPDSSEAKAFKFGVSNSQFWKDNDPLATFAMFTNICDDAMRRHKSCGRK